MLLENIHGVIRRIDYTLTDADIDIWAQQCILAVENETFDFSTKVKEVFTQSGKRRVIYHYPKLSVENFICHYLKKRLDKVFKIEYASRSKIINLLFNTIPALKNMNDFVIIRADFKSFFDSVLSRFVYEKYVLPSLLPRGDKDILEKYIDEYKYCYAGLCLSNGMTEIVCRDFDKKLKARLTSYGVFFYERYVDDMFFNILPYKSISAFTSSEEWLVLNSKYAYFIKTDYKACFDSIYTHTYTWLIGKDSIDTKEFDNNSNIYSTIDRVLQNINARRSNGIVVGPEFSRMIAELMLQFIDVGVNSRLLNSGVICGQDYNVYRYVDDIFIFAKTEELANLIVEMYSELARKYLLRLNESKLYRSKVPFVLEGWLIEANLFTNRICEMLFTTKEEQKAYVEREMQMENDNVRPYLLKSHVIRYGSKSKQSIMNQLNEIVCKYETKDRTLIAYFLSAILNHVGKNKDKVRIFKKDVSESTVFSFLDLVFYAYSFFPNYNNTQKLLSIISYVRDEYDIFSKSRSLQNLLNKYAFVFEKANLNDIVDLFLFCAQAEIEIPYVEEERIVKKLYEKDDPILWATYLLYSKYNEKYYNDIKTTIEQILAKRIEAIRVQKSIFEYREFWWVLVFNKCPLLSSTSQILINGVINSLPYTGTGNRNCADIALDVFVDYLKNNGEQFFEWDMSRKDFLRTITFKTHEKSIFKNYKESVASLVWGSI